MGYGGVGECAPGVAVAADADAVVVAAAAVVAAVHAVAVAAVAMALAPANIMIDASDDYFMETQLPVQQIRCETLVLQFRGIISVKFLKSYLGLGFSSLWYLGHWTKKSQANTR